MAILRYEAYEIDLTGLEVDLTGYERDLLEILSKSFGHPMDAFVDVVNQPDMRLNEFFELFNKTLENISIIIDFIRPHL